MAAEPQKKIISPEEYLVMEAVSPVKHEYFNGEIFQMAGASFFHNLLTMNISGLLFSRIDKKQCSVVQSEMRLKIEGSGLFTYPDVMVVCGRPELVKIKGLDSLLNPVLIVEVLSPSTEAYDKGDKFDHYRTLGSLQEYVLVWQDKKRVARYRRLKDGSWLLNDFIGESADIELTSVGCTLTVDEIYDKVELEDQPD